MVPVKEQTRKVCVSVLWSHIPFFRRVDALRAYFKEFFEPRVELIYYFAFCAHLMLNTLQIEKLQIVEVRCLMEIIKQVKSIDMPFMTMDVVHTNVPLLQSATCFQKSKSCL